MDVSLLKKMNIYPTEAASAGLIPPATTGESTLVKADISLFHDMPLSSVDSKPVPTPQPQSIPDEVNPTASDDKSSGSDYAAGLADGKAQSDIVYEDTISILQKSVDALQSKLGGMAKDIEKSHMAAVAECLHALMPSLKQKATDLELQKVIQQACSPASEGTVQVRVHPDDHAHTQRLCQPHGSKISVTVDALLAPGDVGVEWVSGGAEINCEAAVDACLSLLGSAYKTKQTINRAETIDG